MIMNITEKRTSLILECLQNKHDASFCRYYGEPGYDDPDFGIIFANCNNISGRIGDYLEAAGFELEWSDEWVIDYNHDKAYRTSPNSYSWQPTAIYDSDSCDLLTPDSDIFDVIKALQSEYTSDEIHLLPPWITEDQLTELGFIKQGSERESGWHPGQTADPKETLKELLADSGVLSVVFTGYPSQFYTTWQAWVKYDTL